MKLENSLPFLAAFLGSCATPYPGHSSSPCQQFAWEEPVNLPPHCEAQSLWHRKGWLRCFSTLSLPLTLQFMKFEDVFQNKLPLLSPWQRCPDHPREPRGQGQLQVSQPGSQQSWLPAGREQEAPGWSSTWKYVLSTHWDPTDIWQAMCSPSHPLQVSCSLMYSCSELIFCQHSGKWTQQELAACLSDPHLPCWPPQSKSGSQECLRKQNKPTRQKGVT